MVNYYLKMDIQMKNGMEKEKNMILIKIYYYLMVNIKMEKEMGKEKNMDMNVTMKNIWIIVD